MKRLLSFVILTLCIAGPARAEPVLGIWQAPPDAKGQIGHIEVSPCGDAICGTVIRAFSPDGREVVTPNVGRRVMWGMHAKGGGKYDGGRIYVPARGRDYRARMSLNGARLTIQACLGPICESEVMQRVR